MFVTTAKTSLSILNFGILICIMLFLPAFAGTPDAKCHWTTNPVTIDGKADDWQTTDGAYFENEKAVLFASNDSSFLYLLLRTNDIQSVRIIKMSGVTLYLDPKGGKKKDFFSLRFRGGPSMELLRSVTPNDGDDRREQMRERWGNRPGGMPPGGMPPGGEEQMPPDSMLRHPSLTCHIEDWLLDKEMNPDGSDGPMAAFDTSQGFYTYEIRVPLRAADARHYGIGAELGKKISVGAIWGDREGRPNARPKVDVGFGDDDFGGPGGGGMGGGMGGGKGGGPTGGGRMGPPMRMQEQIKKREIWVKATLASVAKN